MKGWAPLLLLCACQVVARTEAKQQCIANADCANEICVYGSCTKPQNTLLPATTWMEIAPPSASGYSAQQRTVTVANGVFNTNFAQPIAVEGNVFLGLPFPGEIALTRTSLIPGRPIFFVIPARNHFSALLEPGTYLPSILPDDSVDYPPVTLPAWTVVDASLALTINYPDTSTFNTITGRVAASPDNPLQGISARVYAAGAALTSTAVQTDSNGNFSLLIAPSETQVTLNVGPSTDNPFVPAISIPNVAVASGANTVPTVYLAGIAATATVTGTVSGISASGPSEPLSGSEVIAETQIAGGVYEVGAIADISGNFSLALLTSTNPAPLAYTFTIVPPPGSAYGTETLRYDLSPTGTPAPLSLGLAARFVLSGTVLSASGAMVSNAQVTALPAAGTLIESSAETLTGADGRFALDLDPANYTIDVRPAPGTLLPWTTKSVTITDANADTTITLPAGFAVTGEVTVPTGISIDGGHVDFYAASGAGAILIGSATIETNTAHTVHHYTVILPAALPAN